MADSTFEGCIPALMTPCGPNGKPDFDTLTETGVSLVEAGMSGVVYCGSMGEWGLLSDEQRQQGVAALIDAGLRVVVGTGAQNPRAAAGHAAHAAASGAAGLMVIPRVLSRGSSVAAQRAHFAAVLDAADGLPAVIYNSPYYGFETRADLFFDLRDDFPNLVGYKEFGGAEALSYACEHITSGRDDLTLVVGVDTQVVHGVVNCGATGVITGIGNVLPDAVLDLYRLSMAAAGGDAAAHRAAVELDRALGPLSVYDEGPDLVLYYKHLAALAGNDAYRRPLHPGDELSASQRAHAEQQFHRFIRWRDSYSQGSG